MFTNDSDCTIIISVNELTHTDRTAEQTFKVCSMNMLSKMAGYLPAGSIYITYRRYTE